MKNKEYVVEVQGICTQLCRVAAPNHAEAVKVARAKVDSGDFRWGIEPKGDGRIPGRSVATFVDCKAPARPEDSDLPLVSGEA